MSRPLLALLALAAACGKPAGTSCGIAALAGPTSLLSAFSVPNTVLGSLPARLPPRVVARLATGPAYPAIVGRTDSLVVIGVEGALPAGTAPQFGVLVVDPQGAVRGVMLFEAARVEGAPVLGTVTVGPLSVPLLGLQVDPATFESPGCPSFPDSLLR